MLFFYTYAISAWGNNKIIFTGAGEKGQYFSEDQSLPFPSSKQVTLEKALKYPDKTQNFLVSRFYAAVF